MVTLSSALFGLSDEILCLRLKGKLICAVYIALISILPVYRF